MTNRRAATFGVAMFGAITFGLAPWAHAAPSAAASAEDVVTSLQRRGYKVILNRTGTAPLQECEVESVPMGRDLTEMSTVGDDREVVTKYTTVYVDARC